LLPIPCHGLLDSFAEIDAGRPTEEFLRLGDAGTAVEDVQGISGFLVARCLPGQQVQNDEWLGGVAQTLVIVVAALRAVVKALWRVGDCEAPVVRFPNEFGVSPACHRARPHLPANARWQAGPGSCGGAGAGRNAATPEVARIDLGNSPRRCDPLLMRADY